MPIDDKASIATVLKHWFLPSAEVLWDRSQASTVTCILKMIPVFVIS